MDVLDGMSPIEERLCARATQNRVPISGAFELTPLCNMNCRMCFIRLSRQQQEAMQPLRTVAQWLDTARQMQEAGTLFLLLTGGEPLLYPGFAELYQELKKMGFVLTINTNGTLIDEKTADLLGADIPRRVNLTLYGASNETYARVCGNPQGFDQAMRGIRLLTERNVPVKINASLIRDNAHEVQKLLDIADELGLFIEMNTYMFPCHRCGREAFAQDVRVTAEEAAQAELEIQKRQVPQDVFAMRCEYQKMMMEKRGEMGDRSLEIACRAGRSSCWVTWQGMLTPCVFMEKGYSLQDMPLNEAWKRVVADCDAIRLPNACAGCAHAHVCSVCPARVYWESGSYDEAPAYFCRYTQQLVTGLAREAKA